MNEKKCQAYIQISTVLSEEKLKIIATASTYRTILHQVIDIIDRTEGTFNASSQINTP